MIYAEIAVNTPVANTYHYHIPPELEAQLQIGHLVRVAFRTAMEAGVVIGIHDSSPVEVTKPVLELLDPEPVVSEKQIALARWMSARYITPLGASLWLWLPPGMVGQRDVLVTLTEHDVMPDDPLAAKIITALRKRKTPMRGDQISRAVKNKRWQKALADLKRAGLVETQSILSPPRVRPKKIQVAKLAIPPHRIDDHKRNLGKRSREAEALAFIVEEQEAGQTVTEDDVLALPDIGAGTLANLIDSGYITAHDDATLITAVTHDTLTDAIFDLRDGALEYHILQVLARDNQPVDVSWVYAQTGATLKDLKHLDSMGLVWLGEQETVRDSLTAMDFVPATPPRLTPAQKAVWDVVRRGIVGGATPPLTQKSADPTPAFPDNGEGTQTPPLTPPRTQGGEKDRTSTQHDEGSGIKQWRTSSALWHKLKPLAQEMRGDQTPAEKKLWEHLRKRQLEGYKFRRQHPIERFIVDFYNEQCRLIIEIDGPTHEHTEAEDRLRQQTLEHLGHTVIRFTNEQIYSSLNDVLNTIADTLHQITNHPHDTSPLPVYGEGSGVGSDSPSTGRVKEGSDLNSPPPTAFLLHGVTGSGKTEIYLRAIEQVLNQGRQAMFLVPEIALTAQTVRRVMARFPGRTAVLHSRLSDGERFDTWRRARAGEIEVIVGTRSALFTPLPDVGVVILDEEHDDSYKQSPPVIPPYYHTRDVAERLMHENGGTLILGSATPDIGTYFRAQRGDITYLHLPQRIMGHRVSISEQSERAGVISRYESTAESDAVHIDLPPVEVVDMREELKRGNLSMFSEPLQTALRQTLDRGEQAILYLNRRGTATYVFCRDCGYVVECPRCDTPMTFHTQGEIMRCHHCDYTMPPPTTCPECHSRRIKYFGAGTQQVEAELRAHFPDAVSLRWDSDTATRTAEHDHILQRFGNGDAQVLIGTQMIAKGLDLPMVTLVGVVSADMGLNLPDFAAGERVFQLLTQVAGRAGRGLLGGKVILQTYQPDHYAIQHAAGHDYAAFYDEEIAYRREMGYPPFRRLVRIVFRYEREVQARSEAERAAELLWERINERDMMGTTLIGPVPCFFSRVNRFYRWQVILRGIDPAHALDYDDFGRGWFVDVDPVNLL